MSMSVEEFDQYLKSQNIESIDSKELLQTILGVKVFDVKDTNEKISQLRESILDSATKAASKIRNDVENIDQKKVFSNLLGIPVEEIDSTPLNILRKDILSKAFESFNQIKNELTANKESVKSNITDPFGMSDNSEFRKEYRNKLAETWENIKKNIGGSSESLISKMITSENSSTATSNLSTSNNESLSILIKKVEEVFELQNKKTSPNFIIDEKAFEKVLKKTGINEEILGKFYESALEKKREEDSSQKLYEVGPKKFKLDRDSILEIANELSISNSDQKKLLSALVTESKETRMEFGKLSGFLTQKGNGLVDILFDLAALTATGVLGLLFGKGILKLADSIFGTDLVGLFESVTAPLKKFSGYILDAMKGGLMFFSVLANATKLIITNIPLAISKFTGDVGKTVGAVSKVAGVASEAGEVAGAAAKTGVMSKVFGGLTKLFGGGFSAALGGIFRKIPIIGGFIDLGAAVSNFSSGDNVGGWLRLLGSIASFTSIIPGFGLIGFGISLLTSLLDDALTEKAGGDVTKKQNIDIFGFIGNLISDWSTRLWNFVKNKFKSVFGFAPDEEESAEPKPMEPETSTSTSKVVEKAKEISSSKTQTESTESNEIDKMSAATGINFRDLSKINLNPMSIPSAPQLNVNDIAKSSQYSISMPESIGINNSSMKGLMDMISNSMEQIMPSQPVSIAGGGGNANMTDMFIHGSRDPIYDARSDWWGVLNKRKW
jgi:hypothetical protein